MRLLTLPLASLLLLPSLALAAPTAPMPTRAQVFDGQRRLDVNDLNLFVTNFGNIGYDAGSFGPGLLFPRGSSNAVLYSAGLWVGALASGQVRVTVAEYGSEFRPGSMVAGGFEDPNRPDLAVWKVLPWTGNPADTAHVDRTPAELAADPTLDPVAHHGWSEYMAHAAPRGAPVRTWALPAPGGAGTLAVPGPDVQGDQMLWCVFNDADPAGHASTAGRTPPLGIEVRQRVFAFNRPGPLANTAFVHWRIVNKGAQVLAAARTGFWLDPDIGGPSDDLVGCDVARSLGFAYNATSADAVYGSTPPALGVDLPGSDGAAAFTMFVNGNEPVNATQSFNMLAGLNADGTPALDPLTGLPSTFYATGDPVAGTGWLDANPSDRRMLLARGPRTLAPGDSIDVWAALIVARIGSRLGSVAQLVCWDDWIEQAFRAGFPANLPPPPACGAEVLNCPRPPSFYAQECLGAGHLSAAQLAQIGALVGGRAASLATAGQPGGFCAIVGDARDARARALAELAALIPNVLAVSSGIVPAGTPPIRLDPGLPVAIPGVLATAIGDLILPGATQLGLRSFYDVAGASHPAPLAGVGAGLESFGGGAGYAASFFGSSLDPFVMPDSFHTVELLFDPSHPHGAHRFLRFELAGSGAPPAVGRTYAYGGYVGVPFVARDSLTGETLDVAFVERTVTDAAGTILPPSSQLATFDSTWAPGEDDLGGREYVSVLARPTRNAPRPELARDGAFTDFSLPWMYSLWSRHVPGSAPIGAGDRFTFGRLRPQVPGVDSRLLDLAALPLADPAVAGAYDALAGALGAINRGEGIPNSCTGATAALASLVSASAQPGRAELEWYVEGAAGAQVQRRSVDGAWGTLGEAAVGGTGRVRWVDERVTAGARYGYRLALGGSGGAPFAGETWLEIPGTARLAIAGFTPNPGVGAVALRFTLPGSGRARVQVIDLSGRQVFARDVSALGAGTHTVPIASTLAPGIYWLRLSHAGTSVSTKGILLR